MPDDSNNQDAPETAVSTQQPAELTDRGLNKRDWRVLTNAIWPGASKQSTFMAIDYCRARRLDPFKRPVHIVETWNSAVGSMIETIWPGIAELRTTAARTGCYAGKTKPIFGPTIKGKWDYQPKKGSSKVIEVSYPEWCEITVFRVVQGEKVPFTAIVYWLEAYATMGKSDAPNSMWQKRTFAQLAKCTEAEALREAFPEEIQGDMSAEEMAGQSIGEEPPPSRPVQEDFADNQANEDGEIIDGEVIDAEPGKDTVAEAREAMPEGDKGKQPPFMFLDDEGADHEFDNEEMAAAKFYNLMYDLPPKTADAVWHDNEGFRLSLNEGHRESVGEAYAHATGLFSRP